MIKKKQIKPVKETTARVYRKKEKGV